MLPYSTAFKSLIWTTQAVGPQAVFIVNVLVRLPEHHFGEILGGLNYTFWPFYMLVIYWFFTFTWIHFGFLFHDQSSSLSNCNKLMLFAFFTLSYVIDLNKVVAGGSFRDDSPWSLLPDLCHCTVCQEVHLAKSRVRPASIQ